jgi:hypothetical protein
MGTVHYGRLTDETVTPPRKEDWIRVTDIGQSVSFNVDPSLGNHVDLMARVIRDYKEADLNDRALLSTTMICKVDYENPSDSRPAIKQSLHNVDEIFLAFQNTTVKVSEAEPLAELLIEDRAQLIVDFKDIDISRDERASPYYSDLFTNKKVFMMVALQYSKVNAETKSNVAGFIVAIFLVLTFVINSWQVCKHGQFFSIDYAETVLGYALCLVHATGIPLYYPGDPEFNLYVSRVVLHSFAYAYTGGKLFTLLLWRKDRRSFWAYQLFIIVIFILHLIFALLRHTGNRHYYDNKSRSIKDHFKHDAINVIIEATKAINNIVFANLYTALFFGVLITRFARMKKQHMELFAMLGLSISYFKYKESSNFRGHLHNTFDGHFLYSAVPSLVFCFSQALIGTEGGELGMCNMGNKTESTHPQAHKEDEEEEEKTLKNEKSQKKSKK